MKSENIPLDLSWQVVFATLDSMIKQCCIEATDGDETQKQIHFPPSGSQHCSIALPCHQGQVQKLEFADKQDFRASLYPDRFQNTSIGSVPSLDTPEQSGWLFAPSQHALW